ncbi:MAG: NTP transferase domain-containing protein [Oscillospiraceae bacterium]|nr:NTP transferase domain-containing protein [Oscillospiraceae bacterium]
MSKLCALILAAGEGSRMKSKKPKALLEVLFKPMLGWIVDSVKKSGISKICVITGHGREFIENYLLKLSSLDSSLDINTIFQSERLGTGHAVLCAKDFLKYENFDHLAILSGDSPLLDSETIKQAYAVHKKENNSVTLISSQVNNPFGCGRIIRKDGKICSVIEQKDADEETLEIREINSGAYWFKTKDLISILGLIKNDNSQNEYYLTDVVRIFISKGKKVGNFSPVSSNLILGANDYNQLQEISNIAQKNIFKKLISKGVCIRSYDGVVIGPDVDIGECCEIFERTVIIGNSVIGSNCKIGPNVIINNKNISSGCVIFERNFDFS